MEISNPIIQELNKLICAPLDKADHDLHYQSAYTVTQRTLSIWLRIWQTHNICRHEKEIELKKNWHARKIGYDLNLCHQWCTLCQQNIGINSKQNSFSFELTRNSILGQTKTHLFKQNRIFGRYVLLGNSDCTCVSVVSKRKCFANYSKVLSHLELPQSIQC